MPYQLDIDGIERIFEFYAPEGWIYWVRERARSGSGRGLPLIIALHGGGQSPAAFRNAWAFPTVADDPGGTVDDRFFTVYPAGQAYEQTVPTGPTDVPRPFRGWNHGHSSFGILERSDVDAIKQILAFVEGMLRDALDQAGLQGPAIDPDRVFVFGYSAGAMLGFRLVRESPDRVAALWVNAGTIGGSPHSDFSQGVVMRPAQGSRPVSLFHHHGLADEAVLPTGTPQARSETSTGVFEAETGDLQLAMELARRDLSPHYGADQYVAHWGNVVVDPNGGAPPPYAGSVQGVEDYQSWRIQGQANPEVTVFTESTLEHDGFLDNTGPRLFSLATIWEWFKAHPRA